MAAGGSAPAGRRAHTPVTSERCEQLEPAAPWIRRVETANARKRVVPLDVLACGLEPARELVEVRSGKPERRMCLPCGRERLFDADVELAASVEREPDAAAGAERLRLLDLVQAEQLAEEATRLWLAPARGCELDVI